MIAAGVSGAAAQPLKLDPTPQDYIERNGGGATIVAAGKMTLDGHRVACGKSATVLDPNLNDYAASYPQFVILNPPYVAKLATSVKLWVYYHECGHLFGVRDEDKADCFAVRRGRAAGWLTPNGLDEVCAFISDGRPDVAHRGGPERCRLMRQCYKRQPGGGKGSSERRMSSTEGQPPP